ncbi:uncharacterized protein PV09_08716 [Verruconis gallopava]|uniref:Xylanolytic transcriptional activator regulatory domain-containing protein n=1 Tax=Verruconis gallopava TaxID=253628 RepID=A0A0D1YFY4_9PEZI|nr:uncharacterized protein PV09_08716 [Verruconis gallopava]KIV99661.1 hypothetical protein PV09_08716 [Verruconis gallopava]
MRWSILMGTAPEFREVFDAYSKAFGHDGQPRSRTTVTDARVNQITELLLQCKRVARIIKLRCSNARAVSQEFNLILPSKEVADQMATNYFNSFESTYRILHIPTFWRDYQSFWLQPQAATVETQLQILLVVAIGSSLHQTESPDAELRNSVYSWVYAAQSWLSGPLEKEKLTFSSLQIYCLAILAREIFSIGGDLVWMSMGSLVNRAMQMGLHRDPKHLPPMSTLQAELRRRLWATILEMLVQSSLDSALPPRISLSDFDTAAPVDIEDHWIDDSTTEVPTAPAYPLGAFTSTSIQKMLLASLPTRLRIVNLLNGLHTELSYSDALVLSSEILQACQSLQKSFRNYNTPKITAFHRNLLEFLVRRFVMPLHCPFLIKSKTHPEYCYSLQVSVQSAMAILSPEPDADYSHLMALGGGMFKEGVRCAGTVLSLEFIRKLNALKLDGTLKRCSENLEVLRKYLQTILSLSTERIRQGETNVKMHLFISMILAHARAVDDDVPCEPSVTRAATESLEFCLELLKARIASLPPAECNGPDVFTTSTQGLGTDMDFGLEFFFDNTSPF